MDAMFIYNDEVYIEYFFLTRVPITMLFTIRSILKTILLTMSIPLRTISSKMGVR